MKRRDASIRQAITTSVVVLAVIVLVTAGALVFLARELRIVSSDLRASVESVRLVEEASVDLLLHERVEDPVVRVHLESKLRDTLRQARAFVTTQAEGDILDGAEGAIEQYVQASARRDPDSDVALQRAFASVGRLTEANVGQARAAERRAESASALAWFVVAGAVITLALVAGGLLSWLRERALAPVLSLGNAMRAFGRGELGVRAVERGPAELRDMARRFNDMAAAIEAQRERQMTFLAGIAHDLRNPLSALRMSLRIAGAEQGVAQGTKLRSMMDLIARQVSRLDRIVGDFLDRARIESGDVELRPVVVDLRQLAQNVAALYRDASARHVVECELPPEPVAVYADPDRLEQVLNNLVSNAIKYSPRGGRVSIVVASHDSGGAVTVTDEGVGISAADLDYLFEPFHRGRNAADVPGVGLGLHVTKRIVEAHGGSIAVRSAQGAGSTFEVHVPRAAAAATA
jgi:signal transduction histidine kinase